MKLFSSISACLLIVAVISGCAINSNQYQFKDLESDKVKEISDVTKDHTYFAVLADAEVGHLLGYGGHIIYGSSKYGTLDLQGGYNREVGILNRLMIRNIKSSNFAGSNRVSYKVAYSYPLFMQLKEKKFAIPIERKTFNKSSSRAAAFFSDDDKLLFSKRSYLDKVSLGLGFKNVFTGFSTENPILYGIPDKYIAFNNVVNLKHYYAIYSTTQIIELGIKFSRLKNSYAKVEIEGDFYSGREQNVFNAGANILVGISSQVNTFDFKQDQVDATIDIRNHVGFKPIGYEIYLSLHLFSDGIFSSQFKFSTGFYPGYYATYKDAYFAKMGLSLGLGRFFRK